MYEQQTPHQASLSTSPENNTKPLWFGVVGGLVIIIGIIFVFTITPEEEYKNWQTYRNEEYGFEIKYPKKFGPNSIGQYEYLKGDFIVNEKDNYISFGPSGSRLDLPWGIFISNTDPIDMEKYIAQLGDQLSDRIEQRKNISIDGKNALSITITNEKGTWNSRVIYITHNDKIYRIHEGGSSSEFDLFLRSFKFIDEMGSYTDGQTYNNEEQAAKVRDVVRRSHIVNIRLALELYYQENNQYPVSLSSLVPKWLEKIPKNPRPNGIEYVYQVADDKNDFFLEYVLELDNPASGLKAGKNIATSKEFSL